MYTIKIIYTIVKPFPLCWVTFALWKRSTVDQICFFTISPSTITPDWVLGQYSLKAYWGGIVHKILRFTSALSSTIADRHLAVPETFLIFSHSYKAFLGIENKFTLLTAETRIWHSCRMSLHEWYTDSRDRFQSLSICSIIYGLFPAPRVDNTKCPKLDRVLKGNISKENIFYYPLYGIRAIRTTR